MLFKQPGPLLIPFDNSVYAKCKNYSDYKKLETEKQIGALKGQLDAELRRLEKLEKDRVKANKDIWGAIRRRDTAAIKKLVVAGVDLESRNTAGVTVAAALRSMEPSWPGAAKLWPPDVLTTPNFWMILCLLPAALPLSRNTPKSSPSIT